MNDEWNMYPRPAVHGLIEVMRHKMKLKGIALPDYRVDKSGKLKPIDKTPAPLRKGKQAQAKRKAKQWEKAQQK